MHESLKSSRKEILWSTLVQYFGKVIQIALGIISIKLVTNALGAEQYGLYGKITEYALFFSVAANLGIFGNIVRKMSEKPKDGQLFINALVLRLFTAALFLAAGASYAYLFIPNEAFKIGMLFFIFSLFFDYVTSICDAMLQANYLMGSAVFALILGRIANLVTILFLIYYIHTANTEIFLLAPLAASIVTMSFSLFFVKQKMKFKWKLDKALLWMLFITALPFGIINIINNLYFRFLPGYFATLALTESQFGSYSISLHIASTVSLLSTYTMFSTLPAFKRAIKDKHMRTAKTMYKDVQKALLIIGLLAVSIGSWVAPFAIQFVSGKDFIIPKLWFILPLMLILAAISYFYDLVLLTLFAFEKELWFLKREVFALILALAILASSTLPNETAYRIILIISAAIASESLMVILGLRQIRKEFKNGSYSHNTSLYLQNF